MTLPTLTDKLIRLNKAVRAYHKLRERQSPSAEAWKENYIQLANELQDLINEYVSEMAVEYHAASQQYVLEVVIEERKGFYEH